MKTEQDRQRARDSTSLAADVNGFDNKARIQIDELERKKAEYERRALETAKTNPLLAQKYYQGARSFQSQIAAINTQRINSELAVVNSQVNELNVEAAKILQSTAATQSAAARSVNPEKIHTLADMVSRTSAQLAHTSKITNDALGGISERANAEREGIEEDEMAGEGQTSDFMMWVQQQESAPVPVGAPVIGSGAVKAKEENWRSRLLNAAEAEKQ